MLFRQLGRKLGHFQNLEGLISDPTKRIPFLNPKTALFCLMHYKYKDEISERFDRYYIHNVSIHSKCFLKVEIWLPD